MSRAVQFTVPVPEVDVQDFAVLAFAEEAIASPTLLGAYAARFSSGDAATLVVYAPDARAEDVEPRLLEALAAGGVTEDAAADVLAVPSPRDSRVEAHLGNRVHALLSDAAPAGRSFAHLPRFGSADAARLRAAAERQWARPDRPLWEAQVPDGVPQAWPPGHFYSPLPDARELHDERRRSQVWPAVERDPLGIDMHAEEQLRLCREVFGRQRRLAFPDAEPPADAAEYWTGNDQFPPLDAWVLEAMLQHVRPRHMVEIGSGFSSLVTARVNRELLGGSMRFTCVEPNPRPFLVQGVDGITEVIVEKLQDTPVELFEEMRAGDVFFLDSSHTVKTGSDVNWAFHEVLPRLASGVWVHVHDVFLPSDYPQKWVYEGWGWNEQYLVQSFLMYNAAFEVAFANHWMIRRHRDVLLDAFPGFARHEDRAGVSLWLRRR